MKERVKERHDNMHKVFNDFDVDGSGSIDLSELNAAIKILGVKNVPKEKVQELFEDADEDKKGHIGFAEFCDMIDGRLQELDDIVLVAQDEELGLSMLEMLQGMKCHVKDSDKLQYPKAVQALRSAAEELHHRNAALDQSVEDLMGSSSHGWGSTGTL